MVFLSQNWDPSFPTAQPASPVAGNVTQDEDIDEGEELTAHTTIVTPESSSSSVVEAPPKGKNEKHFQKSLIWQI